MARSRDPFNQALSALRDGLAEGRLRAGSPVIVAAEAERLRLSITPVREALARLNGEGLVERAPGGGYLAARLESADAADGYRLLHHLVRLAAVLTDDDGPMRVARPPERAPGDPHAVRYLFDRFVRGSGNGMLSTSSLQVRRRLAPLTRAELLLFTDAAIEAEALYDAAARSSVLFQSRAADYFERRIHASPVLVRLAEELPGPD